MGVLALLAREAWASRLVYLLLYNLMFVAPLVALLAVIASRRTLNTIAHWYLPRKVLAKGIAGAFTAVLGFVVLMTV